MKRKKLLPTLAVYSGLFALALAPGFQTVQADEVKFEDLKKNLKIDKSPAKSENGAIISYAPALEGVMPAVVTIFASKSIQTTSARNPQQEELFRKMFPDVPDDFFEKFDKDHGERQEQGLGSGVIISSDGYILTNNHVVGDADEIKVTMPDSKKEYKGEFIGGDPRTDVALFPFTLPALLSALALACLVSRSLSTAGWDQGGVDSRCHRSRPVRRW